MTGPDRDELRAEYAQELAEARHRRYRGCACDPGHELPGTCPGIEYCPLQQEDPDEEEGDA